ncbi:MAG: pirin family protein [Proteobacteria bacterium]|nr:pirin family protein [Pseudomonadota bacterium]
MSVCQPVQIVTAHSVTDGAGVHLHRAIGTPHLEDLDPFLLLDEFRNDDPAQYIAGFPDHPHRGIETVTYMLAGAMRHGDNQGNAGRLGPGDVQWMTAGRGIVHSEMPEQEKGLLWGFQLWVNLAADRKMSAPRYQEIKAADIPVVTRGDVIVKVIAGALDGVSGAIHGIDVDPTYFDVALPDGAAFVHELPAGHAAFAYVFEGATETGGGDGASRVGRGHLAVLGSGDQVRLRAKGGAARVLVVAGRPLREPIVRYGPFVMNTREQIVQAIDDFRAGRFT